MRPTPALVVVGLLAIAVCLFVAMVILRSGDETGNGTADPLTREVVSERPSPHQELPAALVGGLSPLAPSADPGAEDSDQLAPDDVSLAAESLPHIQRSHNPFRMYVDPEYFEQKYEGASIEDLVVARFRVEQAVHDETNAAVKDRFARGLATVEVLDPPENDELVAPPGERRYGIVHSQLTESLPNGQRYVQKTRLPWEEYVDLYNTKDELHWLIRKIRKVEERED